MKRLLLSVAACVALTGVAACDNDADYGASDADTAATSETTVVETTAPAPTVTETAVVATPAPTDTPDPQNTVTIGPNGVSAEVHSGDTTVRTTTQ